MNETPKWTHRDSLLPPTGIRILAFSPIYQTGDVMRHRMMDSQFFRICTEATHWMDVNMGEPNSDQKE